MLADDKGAAGEGDEDLAHDDVSNVVGWLAEVDHEPHAKEVERCAEVKCERLDAAGEADGNCHDDGPETGADRKDVGDVSGGCDGEPVHDLEVGDVVAVPEVERDEGDSREAACADDGAVYDEVEGDKGAWREVFVVEAKDEE